MARYIVLSPFGCRVETDRRLNVGIDAFHSHRNALAVAHGINERAGRKAVKVVVGERHFLLVDHTWERND